MGGRNGPPSGEGVVVVVVGGASGATIRGRSRKRKKMKDNAINKIYKITNNALGISLIVTQPYYAEVCKGGSLWFVSLLRHRLR